ncbi:hypothetical protein [Agrococcus jenensis]|uniref:DoxX-like protein n=1 Tax=Agrococcus jenensis TaxID=46353 RepID=A0A3N2AUT1_9MICO|nr:hypothetical protein [Agrococcus jenensis]ROR66786.1 hypothetical protein EDD26_2181 [Agrococcus jenensis]
MDAIAIAQLVLRVLLAAAFVAFGLSHRWWRVQKTLIETVIPSALIGAADGAAASRRAMAIANGLLAASVIGGLALLAPWELVRLSAGIALAALVLTVAVVRFLDSRAFWSEPAFRGELVLDWTVSAAVPALIVISVL